MSEESKKTVEVNLNDNCGHKWDNSIALSRFRSILRVSIKVFFLVICVAVCCILFWIEAKIVAHITALFTLEELKQLEDEEAALHLKNFTLLLWIFAVYTLTTEMMNILGLNDKIRILEALRHRTKMESIISLIRQKTYFDADAVQFIIENQQNLLIETVNDELEAEEMVHHRVHGLDPNRKFDSGRD